MIYVLHIDPPLKGAAHVVGWQANPVRDVTTHIRQVSHPTILAAVKAGCTVMYAGTVRGRAADVEHMNKDAGYARASCPICRREEKIEHAVFVNAAIPFASRVTSRDIFPVEDDGTDLNRKEAQ